MADVIEVAKTGRAKCRTCNESIAKGELRFGEEEVNQFSESGGMTLRWHHLACAAGSRPTKFRVALEAYEGDVPDRAALLATAGESRKSEKPSFPYAEHAPTGRSKCLSCGETIVKGAMRVAIEREVDTGTFSGTKPGYLHLDCTTDFVEDEDLLENVLENSRDLSEEDIEAITEALKLSARAEGQTKRLRARFWTARAERRPVVVCPWAPEVP